MASSIASERPQSAQHEVDENESTQKGLNKPHLLKAKSMIAAPQHPYHHYPQQLFHQHQHAAYRGGPQFYQPMPHGYRRHPKHDEELVEEQAAAAGDHNPSHYMSHTPQSHQTRS
jgi:hypothetical protein